MLTGRFQFSSRETYGETITQANLGLVASIFWRGSQKNRIGTFWARNQRQRQRSARVGGILFCLSLSFAVGIVMLCILAARSQQEAVTILLSSLPASSIEATVPVLIDRMHIVYVDHRIVTCDDSLVMTTVHSTYAHHCD